MKKCAKEGGSDLSKCTLNDVQVMVDDRECSWEERITGFCVLDERRLVVVRGHCLLTLVEIATTAHRLRAARFAETSRSHLAHLGYALRAGS